MAYRELTIPSDLRPLIAAVWCADDAREHLVLPDGATDLLLAPETHGVRVVGVMTRARRVPAAAAPRAMMGIRLHPWSAFPLLGTSASELRDAVVSLRDVRPDLASALDGAEILGGTADADRPAHTDRPAPLDGVLAALRRHVATTRADARLDARVRRAVTLLQDPGGPAPIGVVAASLGCSERHLERLVQLHVGLAPKRLARILRLQAALSASRRTSRLTDVAAEAGYADQAHLARDIRALTGLSPTALLRPA